MKCPKCGKELPDGTSFCLYCFTSLAKTDAAPPPVAKGAGKGSKAPARKTAALVLLCLFAVAIICGSAVFFKSRIPKVKTVSAGETAIVTVTDTNGKAVTNESGEAVTEAVVEVTDNSGEAVTNEDGAKVYQAVVPVTNASGESVTNKSGEQVFAVVTQAGSTEAGSTSQPATKKSLFDRLFGNDDTTAAVSSTSKNTALNEPATASTAQPSTPTPLPATQPSTTATQPATLPTTGPTQPATQTTTQKATVDSASDFEYDIYNQYVQITKYTGANTNITVPAEIDGTPVGYLGMNAFPSDTKTITFNSNNYSIGHSAFAQCPDLEAIYFSGKATYKSVDGVVFVGNSLSYYPAGKKTAEYATPAFCKCISTNAVRNNPYLKTFTITADNMQYTDNARRNFTGCPSLTAIHVQGTTSDLTSNDGVLIHQEGKSTYFVYPAGKQDSAFVFPAYGTIIVTPDSFCGNPYLKTLTFKSNMGGFDVLQVHNSNNRPKNLATIYLLDNDNQREFVATGYNAWCFEQSHITVEFY